ncbi:LacI family DNA-binding transcriptional regulator [Aggregatilinea lenta]|uniref:LacI family DNA-binding transcriptional regulator n=1 Tax=Aggregatilinea lenta TaxID=913108 RepID=UPI0013C30E7B|nr:LacI family DNA-binding transcriptional regulator [Aggregatilinea lenta]
MTKRPQSLEDIAAKAGVSRSTVSRIINNTSGVSERTRQRVLKVIAQEGFAPNPSARALVTRRTQVISVVIPLAPLTFFEDTFYFPTLLQGISMTTSKRDHAMMLWLLQSEEEHHTFYRRIVTNRLMDGVVIASATRDEPLIEYFLESGIPFVMVERPSYHLDQISFVSIDNEASAYNAVTHLIALGRRRIGHITGNLGIADGVDRVRGYERALATAGLPVDQTLIVEGNFSHNAGYLGAKQLVEQHVDAIFAANDITARGVLQALHEIHIRVPDDIALIGFDDLPTASQLRPRLTTVRHPVQEKGQMAASILLDLIEDPGSGPHQVTLPTQLIVRDSCVTVGPL